MALRFVLFCSLFLCSSKSLVADTKSPTILALGDSLTFGYEVDSKYSWPSLVEKKATFRRYERS